MTGWRKMILRQRGRFTLPRRDGVDGWRGSYRALLLHNNNDYCFALRSLCVYTATLHYYLPPYHRIYYHYTLIPSPPGRIMVVRAQVRRAAMHVPSFPIAPANTYYARTVYTSHYYTHNILYTHSYCIDICVYIMCFIGFCTQRVTWWTVYYILFSDNCLRVIRGRVDRC